MSAHGVLFRIPVLDYDSVDCSPRAKGLDYIAIGAYFTRR